MSTLPSIPPPNHTINSLIARNKLWAERHSQIFPDLEYRQSPEILWIGCSDSRVPETSLLDLSPGHVFVHRNIANVLPASDLSSQSVIQYAVEVLKVRLIIVCGHHNCGGVKAALTDQKLGLIDNWIKYIRDVRERHRPELDAISDFNKRTSRLVELNVIAQVHNLKGMPNVQEAIKDRGLEVHGLVYGVGTGLLEIPNEGSHP